MKSSFCILTISVFLAMLIQSPSVFAKERMKEPQLVCNVLRPRADEDQVTVISKSPRKAVLEVLLKRGINGAELHFLKKYKPDVLEIRFKGFRNLESFSIQNERSNFSSSLKMAPTTREVVNGSNHEQVARLNIKIEQEVQNDLILVSIPCSKLLAKTDSCKLFWIDAYRQ